jgi:hypothetical protein
MQAKVIGILQRYVEPIFKPGTKFAVIARTPGNDEADVLVTDDSIDALIQLLERSKAREPS